MQAQTLKSKIFVMIVLATILMAPAIFLGIAYRNLATYGGLESGDELPEAELLSPDGKIVSTLSWRGAPLLIILYKPRCPACRAEIDYLASSLSTPSSVAVILVPVTTGPVEGHEAFPVYRDLTGDFLKHARKLIVPTIYWTSAEGRVEYAGSGMGSGAAQALLERLGETSRQARWTQEPFTRRPSR